MDSKQAILHAIAQLVDQIYVAFEKNEYTLGVFIDLSNAFDTVDHSILLRKIELYGVTGRNYAWSKNYLSNRLQYIQVDENYRIEYCVVKCGVPRGSKNEALQRRIEKALQRTESKKRGVANTSFLQRRPTFPLRLYGEVRAMLDRDVATTL